MLVILIERASGFVALIIILCIGLIFNINSSSMNIKLYLPLLIIAVLITGIYTFKKIIQARLEIKYSFILQIIFISMIAQSSDIFIAYLVSGYFKISLNIFHFMIIMPVVYIATVLPISLGGIGVREGSMVALFSMYGIDNSTAVIISLIMYLSKIGIGIIGLPIYLKNKT